MVLNMVREHPIAEKEFKETIQNVKGLSPTQKAKFIEISEQTGFRQYAKTSNLQLKKIVKTVKKQVKLWYKPNGEKRDLQDMRGELKEPPKKGTTKKEMKEHIEKKKNPIKSAITKKEKLTRAEKERKRQYDLALQTGKKYSKEEVREGINSKRSIAYRKRKGITDRGKENEK